MIKNQIKKGAIISYVSVFLNLILLFFYTPWMIKKIGVSDYGLYSLAISFIAYFVMDFGLSGTITRFIAKYRAEGNLQKIENMLGLTTKAYLAIDTVIFLVLLICYLFITEIFKGLTPEELEKFKVLFVIAGTFSVLSFVFKPMHGTMMAFEYFVEEKTLSLMNKWLTAFLVIIALWLDFGVYALVFIHGCMGFIISWAKYAIFRYKSKIRINWTYFDKAELKSVLSFSVWVFLITLAQRMRLSLSPTILGIVADTTEISRFSMAFSIEGMVWIIAGALNGLFLPKVSRMLHKGQREDITDLMIKVGRIQLFVISSILLSFWLIGDKFLHLWVGDNFASSYYVFILITFTNFITTTQHIANDVVYAENKVRYTSTLTLCSSILSLILCFIFSYYWGAIGAGIAFFVAMSLYIVLVNLFYVHKLHLEIGKFFRNTHFKILPPLIALNLVFFVIKRFFALDTWLSLIAFELVYIMAFGCLIFFVLFNQYEKNLVINTLRRRKNGK